MPDISTNKQLFLAGKKFNYNDTIKQRVFNYDKGLYPILMENGKMLLSVEKIDEKFFSGTTWIIGKEVNVKVYFKDMVFIEESEATNA